MLAVCAGGYEGLWTLTRLLPWVLAAVQQHICFPLPTAECPAAPLLLSLLLLYVLTGVWLLARCADLKWMQYDINQFWHCIKVLVYIGFGSRITACLGLLVLNRDKTL